MELKSILVAFLLPPGGPILLVLGGLLLGLRAPAVGRAVAFLGVVMLYLFSIPAFSGPFAAAIGGEAAMSPRVARQPQAIVVLAAGLSGDSTEASGVTLGPLTLERVRYAARLARDMKLPLAVSGGARSGRLTEADLMQKALTDEYALPARWVEARSTSTRENASYTAALLRADGVRTILLVTHPFDARRARRAFEAQGMEVIAAPAQVPPDDGWEVRDFLPSIWALLVSHYTVYELLALARDALF